jgi:hypothetical protein
MQGAAPPPAPKAFKPQKSEMGRLIDGDTGPAMTGVTTYPYSRAQQLYLEDFRALVAGSIDHPFMATTAFNCPSIPHGLLSGSNYDDDRMGGVEKKWRSEYRRSFPLKSYVASKNAESSGVRSEQFQFLG